MRRIAMILAVSVVATLGFSPGAPARSGAGGARDATVVAVIDFGFTPYHWDFLASKMPRTDLPLSRPSHTWLSGAPKPGRFDSYNRINLSLDGNNPNTPIDGLRQRDEEKWASVKQSSRDELHYYWFPGTKVIGALDFGGAGIVAGSNAHGTGTTSVSVGNLHGTCPECLLVFIDINDQASGEAAIEWALKQPWIDVVTNSYGYSLLLRDRIYGNSDVDLQRKATNRGQTIFFSAGNGQDGAFIAPNTTQFSSQEGPDWIVTVGAVSPGNHASYTGHGRPADIAGIGSSYPAAYNSPTVGGTGSSGFGGTSNATPQVAGTYARALYHARTRLGGPSRIQRGGVIARGKAIRCGAARRNCELGDGRLTANELRRRFFHGAIHTEAGLTPGPLGVGELPPIGEDEFLSEGHGSYFGREPDNDFRAEFGRILDPMLGRAKTLERPEGERDWMIVDSYCRQNVWGSWKGGYYVDGRTELPGDDPGWPLRSTFERTCPHWQRPPNTNP